MKTTVDLTSYLYNPASRTTYGDYGSGYTENIQEYEGISRFIPKTIYNAKSASGWRAPSAYQRKEERWTEFPTGQSLVHELLYGVSQEWYRYQNSWGSRAGKISLILPPPRMEDVAIIKALGKLKAQNINLSVAFGERKEAAEMMTNTVVNIARSVRKFKMKRPKDWLKILKRETGHGKFDTIPNSWLELQYGWKPLMSDVHGAVSALHNRERDGDAYRATVKATVLEKGQRLVVLDHVPGYKMDVDLDYMYGVKVRLDYVLENPLLATLASTGITNPLELAWELVPYSFVIDWFTPIGSYLSAMDAALGWDFKAGSSTKFTRQQGNGLPRPEPLYGYKSVKTGVYSHCRYHCNQMMFDRRLFQSSPLPRFPGIKNPLSTGHIANAMSLLVSAFR